MPGRLDLVSTGSAYISSLGQSDLMLGADLKPEETSCQAHQEGNICSSVVVELGKQTPGFEWLFFFFVVRFET